MAVQLWGTLCRQYFIQAYYILVYVCMYCQADRRELLKLLGDRRWPWFGNCHRRCTANSAECYNPRHDMAESVLERAGLDGYTTLETDVDVYVSAPADVVDICGKSVPLPEVSPFKLDPYGIVTVNQLLGGAEIYRERPDVHWQAMPRERYWLIFWDVGLLKIRGWWYNITLNGGSLQGKMRVPYQPPANPTRHINPILIIVLREHTVGYFDSDEVIVRCTLREPSLFTATYCRELLLRWITKHAEVIGLQVYYTDGSSWYEKFRACMEMYVCQEDCLINFRSYAMHEREEINFFNLDHATLDHYVNLHFYTRHNLYVWSRCCTPQESPMFDFRARPGDNLYINSTNMAVLSKYVRMSVEIGRPPKVYSDFRTFYSVLLISPDENTEKYPDVREKPLGLFWLANLKFPDLAWTPDLKTLQEYKAPLPEFKSHRYYILLLSHTTPLDAVPAAVMSGCVTSKCGWDLRHLPLAIRLRAVSWFNAHADIFSEIRRLEDSFLACNDSRLSFTNRCHNDTSDYPYYPTESSFTIHDAGVEHRAVWVDLSGPVRMPMCQEPFDRDWTTMNSNNYFPVNDGPALSLRTALWCALMPMTVIFYLL